MTNQDLENIKKLIGYGFGPEYEEFDSLLQQAFIRKSYSREKGGQNNEVLEFIGDKALDIAVVKKLSEYYGYYDSEGEFCTRKGITEGKLTDIKKKLVNSSMLAHRIEKMGLHEYLIMGKGDINKNVQNEESVKEDLFEAIIGAVALDCEWDIEQILDVVEHMLDIEYYLDNGFDDDENYVDLIQQWSQKNCGEVPEYNYAEDEYEDIYICRLYLSDFQEPFIGEGNTKSSARMEAAASAFDYLEQNGLLLTMEDEVGEPTGERAINQLQELAQKGYCEMPEYEFKESFDHNGNSIWRCKCSIENHYYQTESYNKKESKRKAAYLMLCDIMGYSIDEDEDDWD